MIHISGGTYRSRNILTPDEDCLPTKNRVREAMMSAVSFAIPNANVLDLFGGSGALGIEALSRGASSCVFGEIKPSTVALIEKNLASLNEKRGIVYQGDYKQVLARLKGRHFDLVFLDPPYALKEAYPYSLNTLFEQENVNENTVFVLEYESGIPVDTSLFGFARHYTYGKTEVFILRKRA